MLNFLLRITCGLAAFFTFLLCSYQFVGVPTFAWFPPYTAIERTWVRTWTVLGVGDFSEALAPGAEPDLRRAPMGPGWLYKVHRCCVDLSYVMPSFLLAMIVFGGVSGWYVAPRCRRCGKRLRALTDASCPACGASL